MGKNLQESAGATGANRRAGGLGSEPVHPLPLLLPEEMPSISGVTSARLAIRAPENAKAPKYAQTCTPGPRHQTQLCASPSQRKPPERASGLEKRAAMVRLRQVVRRTLRKGTLTVSLNLKCLVGK